MKFVAQFLLGTALLVACTARQPSVRSVLYPPFQTRDFTRENLFSRNIEGPCFDAYGNLYVVNFERDGTVGLIQPDGTGAIFVSLPGQSIANAIQFDSRGDMLLADFVGHNVLRVNPETKAVTVHCHDERFHQPNDLTITKKDVLFASDPSWKAGTGRVWRIDPEGTATIVADSMGTTNGICLSPNERVLYVNESVQRNIWAFDVDKLGTLSNKRLFTTFRDHGLDGMKTDRAGNLYVTRYGKGTVAIFSPTGFLQREVPLTGKSVSNLVIGPDERTVYVTLQDRRGMETFRVR
jgi:sugar lactone lactonase YvrE